MDETLQTPPENLFRVIREAADRSRSTLIGRLTEDAAVGLSETLREFYPDDDFIVEPDDGQPESGVPPRDKK